MLISHHPRGSDDLKTGNAGEREEEVREWGQGSRMCLFSLGVVREVGDREQDIWEQIDDDKGAVGSVQGKDPGYVEVQCRAADLLSSQGYQLPPSLHGSSSTVELPREPQACLLLTVRV